MSDSGFESWAGDEIFRLQTGITRGFIKSTQGLRD